MPAGALGLGALRLESYISEPLESTLTLLTSEEEELSADCFAVVAPPGRQDVPSLTGARITLERSPTRAALKIRTQAPVTEPVVRLRVNSTCSSSGGLSREYLLVLDPRPAPREAVAVAASPAEPVSPAQPVVAAPAAAIPPAMPDRAPATPPAPPAAVAAMAQPPAKAQRPARPAAAPAAAPAQLPPSAAPTAPAASAPVPQARPQAKAEPTAPARTDGDFRLRLSSAELDTSRSRDVDDRKRAEIRERRLLLEQDDQTAALLGLRDNLRQVEGQLANLQRQVTAGRAGGEGSEAADSSQTPASPPPPAEPPRQPVAAQPLVDWPWVILGIVLALAAGGLALWKRRAERGVSSGLADLGPRVARPPEIKAANRSRPPIAEPAEHPAPPRAPARAPVASTQDPAAEEPHDAAQVRLRYRLARFPEVAHGAVMLADPASVVRGARVLHEDGAGHRAIELLELAIADNPGPVAPWLALLEIQRLEGMTTEFCALAARFHKQHPNAPEWPKIQSVGHEFDPENWLFAGGGEADTFNPVVDNWLDVPPEFSRDGQAAALHAAVAGALARRGS